MQSPHCIEAVLVLVDALHCRADISAAGRIRCHPIHCCRLTIRR